MKGPTTFFSEQGPAEGKSGPCQIFATERGVPRFSALTGMIPCQYRHSKNILYTAQESNSHYASISDVLLKTRFFGLHFRDSIGVYLTTFTQSAPIATEFGEITLPLGILRRSRSSKVTEFGTNRKLICDFLLVINANLAPILHRFRDIASKITIFGYPSSV